MIEVRLSEGDVELLVRSLEWLLSETRMEICDTEQAEFRAALKAEKAALERLIGQLKTGALKATPDVA